MHCTVLIPDALRMPGAGPHAHIDAPALATAFARGEALSYALDRDAWLCHAFGIARQHDWPVAPLTLAYDTGTDDETAPDAYWLRADPVYLRADRSRLLLASAVDDLDANETRALAAAFNAHFAQDGLLFRAPHPQRWYLRARQTPDITTTPLALALARNVDPHLPQGGDALAWHRVFTEAQMILHAHPVNDARETRGALPVNSLWLWGGGVLPAAGAPHTGYDAVYADDVLARALAARAVPRAAACALPGDGRAWLTAARASGARRVLIVLDAPAHAANTGEGDAAAWQAAVEQADRDWIAPLLSALRAGTLSGLNVVAPDGARTPGTRLSRGHLWRLWRRRRPLASYASAP